MNFRRRRRRAPGLDPKVDEAPMTPMIDIVFQLLIFFMLTMQFKEVEGKLISQLPKDRGLPKKVFDFQIQSAKTAGKLDKDASEVFEIDMAQVFLRDLTSVTTALVPLTGALDIAVGKQWVSGDEARIIFRTVLEQITRLPDVDNLEGMLEESLPPELKRVASSIGAIWTELKKKMEEGEADDGSDKSTGTDAAAD